MFDLYLLPLSACRHIVTTTRTASRQTETAHQIHRYMQYQTVLSQGMVLDVCAGDADDVFQHHTHDRNLSTDVAADVAVVTACDCPLTRTRSLYGHPRLAGLKNCKQRKQQRIVADTMLQGNLTLSEK